MRKVIVAFAIGTSIMGSAANARDGAVYVGLEGGASIGGEPSLNIGATSNAASIDTDSGWDGGIVVGHDFGNFRLEGEVSLKEKNQQQLVGNGSFDIDPVSAGNQQLASVSGEVHTQSFMLNALYDIGGEDGVAVYAGGGIGLAETKIDTQIFGVVPPLLDDKGSGFAWQLLAGARLPINETLEFGVKYRLFNASGIDLTSGISGPISASYTSHSVLATLTVNLGG